MLSERPPVAPDRADTGSLTFETLDLKLKDCGRLGSAYPASLAGAPTAGLPSLAYVIPEKLYTSTYSGVRRTSDIGVGARL
ncbi:hypothetical protein EVAR_103183_1 [Eumeta japonica]|uniref:Uncharacterized protein n=1 Tax=Eumeta variegata TaxID=151549 RepID=A0A4C1YBM4_EUMVA|nr:hypothetical protein EVAR_103183_1 [Eumeta japonica]